MSRVTWPVRHGDRIPSQGVRIPLYQKREPESRCANYGAEAPYIQKNLVLVECSRVAVLKCLIIFE